MKYRLLVTDYDGTLATDGIVDDGIVETLRGMRARGLPTILVTGRELTSLFNTFAHSDLFELIVAENGGVIYSPATKRVDVIAPAPPPPLLTALERAQVPISVGHAIVATVIPHDEPMRAAIRSLGLNWHVIYNKRAAMALPHHITKATGLVAALRVLNIRHEECVGIGDAENDIEFMRLCGLSFAVANALPQVKEIADHVLTSARGAGVVEVAMRIITGEFDHEQAAS
jgi:hydroxymethylpyrimidine pyrophosphatase-like HAD family hydrolase